MSKFQNKALYAFVKTATADGNWFNYKSGPNKGQPMSNADVRAHMQKIDPQFANSGWEFDNYMRMSSPHGVGTTAGAQAGVPSGAPQAPQRGIASQAPAATRPPAGGTWASKGGSPSTGQPSPEQIWASEGGSPNAGPIGMSETPDNYDYSHSGPNSQLSGNIKPIVGNPSTTASSPKPSNDPFANPKPPANEPRMIQSPDGSWSVRPADGQMFGGLPGNPVVGKQSPTGIGPLPGAQAGVPSHGPEGPALPPNAQHAWNNRPGQAGQWN